MIVYIHEEDNTNNMVIFHGIPAAEHRAMTSKALAFWPGYTIVFRDTPVVTQPPKPTCTFTASKMTGAPGDPITLSFSATGPVQKFELSQDNWVTVYTYTAPGTRIITPGQTPTWKCRVTHMDGTVQELPALTITIRAPITFTATPTTSVAGAPVTLSWFADKINGAYRSNDGITWQGVAGIATETVYPRTTATYQLKVVQRDGFEEIRKVTVTVTPAPPPPVPVLRKPNIIINVLNGGPVANAIMGSLNAPGIQPTFNPGHARELAIAFPSRTIVVRPAIWGGADFNYWRDKTEIDQMPRGQSNVIFLGLNENDCGLAPDDEKGISDRANFDGTAFQYCIDRGFKYAGGGYAVASADMTNPAICAAFRKWYAPLFNRGMYFNLHCYMARDTSGVPLAQRFTKSFAHTMHGKTVTIRQSWWTAEWWRWFPLFCGFDPSKSCFIADEMGLEGTVDMPDAPISGGFRANGNVDMIKYLKDWQYYSGLPVLFGDNGIEYPSNLILGSLYCANSQDPSSKWYGYDITHRLDEIAFNLWR